MYLSKLLFSKKFYLKKLIHRIFQKQTFLLKLWLLNPSGEETTNSVKGVKGNVCVLTFEIFSSCEILCECFKILRRKNQQQEVRISLAQRLCERLRALV